MQSAGGAPSAITQDNGARWGRQVSKRSLNRVRGLPALQTGHGQQQSVDAQRITVLRKTFINVDCSARSSGGASEAVTPAPRGPARGAHRT